MRPAPHAREARSKRPSSPRRAVNRPAARGLDDTSTRGDAPHTGLEHVVRARRSAPNAQPGRRRHRAVSRARASHGSSPLAAPRRAATLATPGGSRAMGAGAGRPALPPRVRFRRGAVERGFPCVCRGRMVRVRCWSSCSSTSSRDFSATSSPRRSSPWSGRSSMPSARSARTSRPRSRRRSRRVRAATRPTSGSTRRSTCSRRRCSSRSGGTGRPWSTGASSRTA